MPTFYKTSYETPNPKDRSQWLAGGKFRNETFAGGQFFSPVRTPAFTNTPQTLDKTSAILNGSFDFLNPAFSFINSFINLGMYDLLVQDSKQSDYGVYSVSVEVIDTTTYETLHSVKRDGSDYDLGTLQKALKSSFSLDELQSINNNPIEITKNMLSNPLMVVIDIATSYDTSKSIEVNLGKVAYGTVINGFRNIVTNKVLSAVGLAPTSLLGMAVGGLLGLAFDEAMEVALGLDTHFGFGGDYVGKDRDGMAMFEEKKGIDQIKNELLKTLGLNYDPFSVNLEDRYGNSFGSTSHYKDGMYDVTATGFNAGNEYEYSFNSDLYDVTVSGLNGMEHTDWSNEETGEWGAYDEASNTSVTVKADGTYDVTIDGVTNSYDANGDTIGGDDSSYENTRNDPNAVSDAEFDAAESSVDKNDGTDDGGGSYIATAMDQALGTDAVKFYEHFRDTYVLKQVGGAELMAKYYATSSKIVEEINKKPYSEKIYRFIYDKYLAKGIELIKAEKHDKAFALYKVMVYDLYKRFLAKK